MARTVSKRMEMAQNGELHAMYTESAFVKIKAAYNIEKVCFSFVRKGTNGKGFDVYVDLDTFATWMEDVQDGTFSAVISAEKKANEKYAKTYKFVTGNNGEKSVGFGVSTTGYCVISGSVITEDKKREYINVPVNRVWMKTLARYFFGTVETKMNELFTTTVKSSEKYRNTISSEDEETVSLTVDNSVPVSESVKESIKETAADSTNKSDLPILSKIFVKAGNADKKVDKNGKEYFFCPVRMQTRNGGFDKVISSLIIFKDEIIASDVPVIDSIINNSADVLSPFTLTVEEAKGMFRLKSIVKAPTVKSARG